MCLFIHIDIYRVFQVALRVGGKLAPVKESEILLGEFFDQVVGTWGGVILTIQTFCKVISLYLGT